MRPLAQARELFFGQNDWHLNRKSGRNRSEKLWIRLSKLKRGHRGPKLPRKRLDKSSRFSIELIHQLRTAHSSTKNDDSKSLQAFRSYAPTSFALLSRNQLGRRRCGTRLILLSRTASLDQFGCRPSLWCATPHAIQSQSAVDGSEFQCVGFIYQALVPIYLAKNNQSESFLLTSWPVGRPRRMPLGQ